MKYHCLFFILSLLFTSSYSKLNSEFDPYQKVTRYIVRNGKSMKVGIISDSQLLPEEGSTNFNYTEHLKTSLEVLKSHDVDAIIMAGDVGDAGTEYAFQIWHDVYEMVYAGNTKPILNIMMGNHDYWSPKPEESIVMQERFARVVGEKPFSHKVINGFHFINWGSEDASVTTCNSNIEWAKAQIDLAIKEDPKKPIFVTTHVPPSGTMYGSTQWGNPNTTKFLQDYPQVVSFSGHSHFALTDERSIWQGTFTAINTQAVAYIELETGKENGSIPKDENGDDAYARRNYMGMIMTVTNERVELQRISLESNKFYKDPWIIDIPVQISTFRYNTEKRTAESVAPKFEGENEIKIIKKTIGESTFNQITFKQATHNDLVQSYRIEFDNGTKVTKLLYFSDFFLMKEERGENIILKLPTLKKTKYTVSIYAIESFGKESEPITGEIEIS